MRATFSPRQLNANLDAILSLNRQEPDLAQGQFNRTLKSWSSGPGFFTYGCPESIDEEDKG